MRSLKKLHVLPRSKSRSRNPVKLSKKQCISPQGGDGQSEGKLTKENRNNRSVVTFSERSVSGVSLSTGAAFAARGWGSRNEGRGCIGG